MAVEIVNAGEKDFDEVTGSGTALVDFWAPWCGPCRMQGEILHEVAEKVGDDVTIAKVNVDEAQSIAARFNVRSIPTLVVIKDGEKTEQFVGVQDANTLVTAVS